MQTPRLRLLYSLLPSNKFSSTNLQDGDIAPSIVPNCCWCWSRLRAWMRGLICVAMTCHRLCPGMPCLAQRRPCGTATVPNDGTGKTGFMIRMALRA